MNETRSIRNWSGDAASFETDVGQPLEDAIEDAIKTGQPTLLYAVASALVEAYQTDRIRRGLWLDLWDRIGHRRMELQESLQDFEKTEAIIRRCALRDLPRSLVDTSDPIRGPSRRSTVVERGATRVQPCAR